MIDILKIAITALYCVLLCVITYCIFVITKYSTIGNTRFIFVALLAVLALMLVLVILSIHGVI